MPRPRKREKGAVRINTPLGVRLNALLTKAAADLTLKHKKRISKNDVVIHCLEHCLIEKKGACYTK